MEKKCKSDEAARKIEEKLRDVSPDDRFHAAFEGVQDSQRDDDENGEPLGRAKRDADHEGNRGNTNAFCKGARAKKRQSGDGPHFRTEALLDKGVGGQILSAEIAGQKDHRNEDAAYEVAEDELKKGHITGERDGGSPDDGQRGGFRRHDRKRESPPWRAAASEEIIVEIVLLLPEADPEERYTQKV